ncbi:MAG TPA: DUF1688 family protein, partial [Allocoleopsis sp.]
MIPVSSLWLASTLTCSVDFWITYLGDDTSMTDSITDSMAPFVTEHHAVRYLRSPQAIREQCTLLFEQACDDRLTHFRCNLSQLDRVAQYVITVMQQSYPDGAIPFHSRWRHFEAGGIDRSIWIEQKLAGLTALEKARAKFDLAVVSVLLDAGAGAEWRYIEPGTGQVYQRSEGLAVASLHCFLNGQFSDDPSQLQANAAGLQAVTPASLAEGFQVVENNPLIGVAGRAALMQQLGQVLPNYPHLFGKNGEAHLPRPGYLVDYFLQHADQNLLKASEVFAAVLEGLSEIWAGRVTIAGANLGDVWYHAALPDRGIGSQFVPFHKLSQWLTYSLLEPLQELGLKITDLDELTGLPEYRNGGLCLDLGLLQAKHDAAFSQPHSVDSEVIVEWRALTVILLDRIAA